MYLILFFAAPIVFITQEKKYGGRLPIQLPLNAGGKILALISLLISLITGLGLIFGFENVNEIWPWELPPLVGGLIGVLFLTHAAAYTWALWDRDWLRVRPIFWQAPVTAALLILLPIFHPDNLKSDAGGSLTLYIATAAIMLIANTIVILSHRAGEKAAVLQ